LNKWVTTKIVKCGSRTYDVQFNSSSELEAVDKGNVRAAASEAKKGSRKAAKRAVKRAEWGSMTKEWQHGALRRACECDKLSTVQKKTPWPFGMLLECNFEVKTWWLSVDSLSVDSLSCFPRLVTGRNGCGEYPLSYFGTRPALTSRFCLSELSSWIYLYRCVRNRSRKVDE
jgi:hypothetical protein